MSSGFFALQFVFQWILYCLAFQWVSGSAIRVWVCGFSFVYGLHYWCLFAYSRMHRCCSPTVVFFCCCCLHMMEIMLMRLDSSRLSTAFQRPNFFDDNGDEFLTKQHWPIMQYIKKKIFSCNRISVASEHLWALTITERDFVRLLSPLQEQRWSKEAMSAMRKIYASLYNKLRLLQFFLCSQLWLSYQWSTITLSTSKLHSIVRFDSAITAPQTFFWNSLGWVQFEAMIPCLPGSFNMGKWGVWHRDCSCFLQISLHLTL